MDEAHSLLIEYDMELVINKQLLDAKLIPYDIYEKVAANIVKDIEHQTRCLDE